jgi:hypothetical protein
MSSKGLEIGLVYMLQPCELLGTNRYKIGASRTSSISRCQDGYKKGSRILFMIECIDPYMIEKILIKEFNNKFELIAGNEYFSGNEIAMKRCFRQFVFDCIDNVNNIEDTYKKFEEQRQKKIQEKKKKRKKTYNKKIKRRKENFEREKKKKKER